MNRRRAFTLLELLIVVSILATLISILLPSLVQARNEARAAACASNLRQIGLANGYYANDNDQYYCPGAADFMATNLRRWHGMRDHASGPFDGRRGPLVRYLGGDVEIRACPAMRIDLPEDDPRRFEKNCGGYGYNLAFVGRQLSMIGFGFYAVESDLVGAKNDRIRSPSTTLMFADTAFVGSALIEYSFAEPRFFPTYGGRPDPSIHFRHNGRKANVAWCDGHVDGRVMTFSWTSGLYQGDPELENVGWFGEPDDNGYFDLE